MATYPQEERAKFGYKSESTREDRGDISYNGTMFWRPPRKDGNFHVILVSSELGGVGGGGGGEEELKWHLKRILRL